MKISLVLLLFCSILYAQNDFTKLYKSKLLIKEQDFFVWVALNPKQRREGLSDIINLEQNSGMLFFYPSAQILRFWMKGTLLDLDIAFLKRDGTVVDIFSMRKEEETLYSSSEEVSLALELNFSRCQNLGLKVGDKIFIPKDIQNLF